MRSRRQAVTPGIVTIGIAGAALTAFEAWGLVRTDRSDVGYGWGWIGLALGVGLLSAGALLLLLNLRRRRTR